MEKSGYGMAKFGLESKQVMPKRDCAFYMRYVFLFTSLIQFLIILGLVLFMVYGNAHAGTDKHVRLLDGQLQEHYHKIITLSGRNANLTRTLNATLKANQGLQGQLQKVQGQLEKCNSSQAPNGTPRREDINRIIFLQNTYLEKCYMAINVINSSCTAEKAQLQQQLETVTQKRKELGQSCTTAETALGKAKQEQERCQQELKATGALCSTTKAKLEQLTGECDTLRSNVLYYLRTLSVNNKNFGCSQVEDQLRLLMHRIEELFSRQQKHESDYVGKSVCDLTLQQCHLNCSHEKQELGRRLQEVRQQLQGSQEEQKKLLAEKERLSKELGEKSNAATQANHFREQFNLCMSSKVPGSAVGSVRPPPFPSTYTDALWNQDKISTEEIQKIVQNVMEQYTALMRNPSG
ncbi:plasmalemma vesicle-associated protein isoform X2 [Phasianus colchicus]|uniref:plasmalemma vesicle-associated protein isoform X2 n=1 Tax=Phasianus colchicus TaxID=9054 RepID=UPI00129D2ED2|nr:plasmalemma vesicle-associated protein isoform X2 [Phasianus colchicus]